MQPVKTKKKLSRADKKQIEAAIARANRTDKKGKSAQDSIPYERMWPDGICRVSDSHYTKTIQFQDINYQLSQNEDKTAMQAVSQSGMVRTESISLMENPPVMINPHRLFPGRARRSVLASCWNPVNLRPM